MDKYEKHMEICLELNQIYKDKNHDYGDSFGETFKKLGIISAVTRITDKVNRLQILCTKESKVKDESIRDTLMDLANYSIMTVIELDEGKKKKAKAIPKVCIGCSCNNNGFCLLTNSEITK